MLKHGILGLLNYGPMTGYELKETFSHSLNYFWTAQTSQVYRELKTLETNGWVTEELVPQVGKPDKKPYTITEEGRAELHRWLSDTSIGLSNNSPLLMKTFFLGELSLPEQLSFFESQIESNRAFLTTIELINERLKYYSAEVPNPDDARYWRMTLDFGARLSHMIMDWSEACMAEIQSAEAKKEGAAQ